MTQMQLAVDERKHAIQTTTDDHREKYGQHLTPLNTARLAASMFTHIDVHGTSCLDLGGGTGMLTTAMLDRFGSHIVRCDTIERDSALAKIYDRNIRHLIDGETIIGDALERYNQLSGNYDYVILNPPYKKMSAQDPRHTMLPIKAPNLYAAFLEIAVSMAKNGGQIVAIIPRSWTNGMYFTLFRQWILEHCSLDAMYIYDSRREVFADTGVLQEIMLVKFTKGPQAQNIKVSSGDYDMHITSEAEYPAAQLIVGESRMVRVEPAVSDDVSNFANSLFHVSTGKVVDFRSLDVVSVDLPSDLQSYVPLIYAQNFKTGAFKHPMDCGKYQWLTIIGKKQEMQVVPKGAYVVIRRFTAKEEKRRVVAYAVNFDTPVALENHLNYIHAGTARKTVPLPSITIAFGIATWLNSTYIDTWFRGISGSTQVNAKDIRNMPWPSDEVLEKIGSRYITDMTQEQIDVLVKGIV